MNHPPKIDVAPEARDVLAHRLAGAIEYVRGQMADEYGEPALEIDAFEVINGTVRLLLGLPLSGPVARFLERFEGDTKLGTRVDEIRDILPGVDDLVEGIIKLSVPD